MGQFFTDLPAYSFLQYALWTALLVSIPCGIMGSYIVTRRITYLAGGIAHTIFGGLGAARYLERVYQVTWLTPCMGLSWRHSLRQLLSARRVPGPKSGRIR